MTTLNERPTEVGGFKQALRERRFLVIAAVVLAIALVSLTARAVYDQGSTSPDEEIEQLLDDYLAAWEAQDEVAVRSATTADFVINEYIYTDDVAGFRLFDHINDDIDGLVSEGLRYPWSNELVGDDRIVTGEGPWFVSVEENWQLTGYLLEGQANYTIVEVDGVLKIANHYWAGLRAVTD